MVRKRTFLLLGAVGIISLGSFLFVSIAPPQTAAPGDSAAPLSACGASCSLVTEPDDGIRPVLEIITHAAKSIDLVMYEFSDPTIEDALGQAARRGVAVRVLLSTAYMGEPSAINDPAYETLRAAGVAVRWAPNYFDLTHEKSIVADGTRALIMTFNLMSRYYPTGRDFGIVDDDANDIAAMEAAFDADWRESGAAASPGDSLVWSPGSRNALLALINHAVQSLDIYNEEMADAEITAALARAAARGVTVNVLMTYAPDWKDAFKTLVAAGVHIRTYPAHPAHATLYIHAKMILADGGIAFIGSENFSETSLDHNRELGTIISNPAILRSLAATFTADWRGAKTYQP